MSRLALPRRFREESGFSLIEVMVAMVAGIVVTGALFAILEVALHQNSRIDDRVQAQQIASNALARVIDPLRSGCISREATPVQTGSTPTKLIFTTAFSQATTPAVGEVYKETVELLSHKLWMKTQKATAGAWPTYTSFEEPGKSTLLAENVYPPSGQTYLFQYYKYGTKSESTSETALSSLEPLTNTGALSEAEAKSVAGVEVGLLALPQDADTRLNRGAELTDQVTFAFSTPNSEGTIKDGPCQ